MITVAELQQNRVTKSQAALKDIEHIILRADAQGKRFIQYDLTTQVDTQTIVTELAKAGFKATLHKGTDMRGESWDYIHISWS